MTPSPADFLPVATVSGLISQQLSPIGSSPSDIELLDLRKALGRIAANDVLSPINVPGHPNSAMDGYAFRLQDLAQLAPNASGQLTLAVVGSAFAGKPLEGHASFALGQAVRIMTGAVLPEGLDTVIPQESCDALGNELRIPLTHGLQAHQNTRKKGEDLAEGKPAVLAGRALTPSDLGLLASLGFTQVKCFRKLRIAVFSTGDEVAEPGTSLLPSQIFDSNRFTLHGMIERLGMECIDLGIVRDKPELLEQALLSAIDTHKADAIITSGGVSVGEADFTKPVLAKLGEVNFWQIAMRPGRPLAFGKIKGLPFFGLPGNPVAVMMTFYFFARQALLQMQGATQTAAPEFTAISLTPIRKRPGRTEFQRAIIEQDMNGQYRVGLTGQQGSGVLSSMSKANCLVVLHHEQGSVNAGDSVSVVPFFGLL